MGNDAKILIKALAALVADFLVTTGMLYLIERCFRLPFGIVEAIGVYWVIAFIEYTTSKLK